MSDKIFIMCFVACVFGVVCLTLLETFKTKKYSPFVIIILYTLFCFYFSLNNFLDVGRAYKYITTNIEEYDAYLNKSAIKGMTGYIMWKVQQENPSFNKLSKEGKDIYVKKYVEKNQIKTTLQGLPLIDYEWVEYANLSNAYPNLSLQLIEKPTKNP